MNTPKIVMTDKIAAASVLGTKAYNEGKNRIPHHDAELRGLLVELQVSESGSILDTWLSNYDLAANRAAYEELKKQHTLIEEDNNTQKTLL